MKTGLYHKNTMRPFFLYVLTATLQYSKGNKVIGVIYEVTEAGLRRLDKWEGYPTVYTHFNIIVVTDGARLLKQSPISKQCSRKKTSLPLNTSPSYSRAAATGASSERRVNYSRL